MRILKKILCYVSGITWVVSAMFVDNDSIAPLIVCLISFLLWIPFFWRKRRVKKYKY